MDNQPTGHRRSKSLLDVIFGTNVSEQISDSDALSQETLAKALDLKIEQERTKQQYYKLENTNRTIDLLQLTTKSGIPLSEITQLISNNIITPAHESIITPTQSNTHQRSPNPSFKFPSNTTVSTNEKGILSNNIRPTHRRMNSPARIGADMVRSLNSDSSVTIKEEDTDSIPPQESPLQEKKLPSLHSYSSAERGRATRHMRNMSLPTMNKFQNPNLQHIPSGMTSILSFENIRDEQPHDPLQERKCSFQLLEKQNNHYQLKKPPLIQKTHRRAKSVSAFGVIDLNIIEVARQKAILNSNILIKPEIQSTAKKDEFDEKTCSESSSRCESPVHYEIRATNSVQRLLND